MDWKQVLPPLCRSRIETRFAPAGEDLPAGSRKFGGRPDVPAGFVWPVFETKTFDDDTVKPRPLAFLAQFDCARLAELDPEGLLPRTGRLSFFYELGSQRWGYDPKDAGGARGVWVGGAPLAPAAYTGSPLASIRSGSQPSSRWPVKMKSRQASSAGAPIRSPQYSAI